MGQVIREVLVGLTDQATVAQVGHREDRRIQKREVVRQLNFRDLIVYQMKHVHYFQFESINFALSIGPPDVKALNMPEITNATTPC